MNSEAYWARNAGIWSAFQAGHMSMRDREKARESLQRKAGLAHIPHSNYQPSELTDAQVASIIAEIWESEE
jgi:hypothetical protein